MRLRLLAALALLGAAPASSADWPTNVVRVTNSITSTPTNTANCTAVDQPYECCTAPTAGCDGLGGEDIQDALQVCELGSDKAPGGAGAAADTNGCTLQLPCDATIDNAENAITSAEPTAGSDVHGIAYTEGFANGLLIRGCGTSTKLRSRAGATGPANYLGGGNVTASVLYFAQWDRDAGMPGQQMAIPRIGFQDFECDGRTPEQASNKDYSAGPSYTDRWLYANNHTCLQSRGFPTEEEFFEEIEISGLYIHHFVAGGVIVGSAAQGLFRGNRVEHVGCWQDFDDTVCKANADPFPCCTGPNAGSCESQWENGPVAGDNECGCASGQPDCYEWNLQADPDPLIPGHKSDAFGLRHVGPGRVTIVDNEVAYATKYGISCDSANPSTLSPRYAPASDLCRIDRNRVNHAKIMAGTHYSNVWMSNNVVTWAGMNGSSVEGSQTIASNGAGRRLWITGNRILASEGPGIFDKSWAWAPGLARTLVIDGNRIDRAGQWTQIQNSLTPTQTPIGIDMNKAYPSCITETDEFAREVEVTNNWIGPNNAATASMSINESTLVDCEAEKTTRLLIEGNTLYPTTWATYVDSLADVQGINIVSESQTLKVQGSWRWMSGATGDCSGWTLEGSTQVIDNSGNGIGTCVP